MLRDFNLTNQTFGTMIRGYYKKPRRSFAMPAFFALLSNKITSPNSENLFRNKPLG